MLRPGVRRGPCRRAPTGLTRSGEETSPERVMARLSGFCLTPSANDSEARFPSLRARRYCRGERPRDDPPHPLRAVPARARSPRSRPAAGIAFGANLRSSHAALVARKEAKIVRFARRYLGVRYSYGGTSPGTGFDCSGFTRFVYGHFGIVLPHYSGAQYGLGRRIGRLGPEARRPALLRRSRPRRHLPRPRAVHPRAAHRHPRLDRDAERLVRLEVRRSPQARLRTFPDGGAPSGADASS